MKKQDRKPKIIVLTGHVQQRKEHEAKNAKADEVLIKPFRNARPYQTIARIVAE
jgi:CheY-like chemotaxis protein